MSTEALLIVLPACLVAFCITVAVTPPAIALIKRFGLLDDPKKHIHPGVIHKKPIPRGGGIPLFIGAIVTSLFFLPLNSTMIGVYVASLLALVVGVIDDKLNAVSKDVSPYLRFFINILTAVIVVGSGVSIHFITNPFGGILLLDKMHLVNLPILISNVISIIWLVWIMNMLNWSKGVDGQMPGIVAISAVVIGLVSLHLSPGGNVLPDAKLAFIITGAALGFLIFNFYPAKIFPGYGATSIYLLLGVASILSSAKFATAILVMGIPLVDFIFTIVRRIIHRQSPFKGDKKHLHHILLRLGYSQRQIALFYWVLSGILGIISLTLESESKIFAIILLIVITGGALMFLHTITNTYNETVT